MFRTRLNPTKPPAAHRAVLEAVGAACRELRPIEETSFAESRPNQQIAAIFAKHGVLGVGVDVQLGGAGSDPLLGVMAAERIGREGFGPCSFFAGHAGLGVGIISRWGTEDQKKRFLTDAARGACILGSTLSSPIAGPGAPWGVEFREIPGGYMLSGRQRALHHAGLAGAIMTPATGPRDACGATHSMFIVDTNSAGIRMEQPLAPFVPPSGLVCNVEFDRCQVPAENRIAGAINSEPTGSSLPESAVWRIANLDCRLLLAGGAIGALADCLEIMSQLLVPHAASNSDEMPHQVAQHIARTAADLEATRALVYAAAGLKSEFDRHRQSPHLARETETLVSEAKYFAHTAVHAMRSRAQEIRLQRGTLLDQLPPRHREVAEPTILLEETSDFLETKIATEYLFF